MEKINGIIISGKVYKAVQGECKDCDLQEQCKDNDLFNNLCNYFEGYQIKYLIATMLLSLKSLATSTTTPNC